MAPYLGLVAVVTDKGNLGKQETSRADAEVVWKNLTGMGVRGELLARVGWSDKTF